jgi:predicted AlkP superfamily phosphohydrolase/phosphomutase
MQNGYGVAKKVIMIGIDGMDPVYTRTLLAKGKLPNIKKFLERGTTTRDMGMMGILPAYTPPAWCSMATGATPGTHGITDFWNHKSGEPLNKLELGFNSVLCKAEYIWDAFARGGKKSIVFGWPTAWPPKNDECIFIDGSGIHPFLLENVDFEKVIQCKTGDFPVRFIPHDDNTSGADCFVTEEVTEKEFKLELHKTSGIVVPGESGEDLNISAKHDLVITPIKDASGWTEAPQGAKEAVFLVNSGNERRFCLITADDGRNYNRIKIYASKQQKSLLGEATAGNWTEQIFDEFVFDPGRIRVAYKIKLLSLSPDASNMRLYYTYALSLDSDKYAYPAEIKKELYEKLGPPIMMSNASHDDPELLLIMAECAEKAFQWTMDAIDYLLDNKEWDAAFHGLHIVDAANHFYLDRTLEGSPNAELCRTLMERFYDIADEYVGRALKWLDKGVSIVVASDHGGLLKYPGYATPDIGDAWGLNIGLMSELGYTKTKVVNKTLEIDWANTTAVAQRSSYIYVNLKGREPEGIVKPEDLDDLVTKIISDLYAYRDPVHGERVISLAMRRSEMEVLGLGRSSAENLGDIFFILEPKFTRDQGNSFSNTEILGTSLKCIFMMAGAGIKENHVMNREVFTIDLVPTLCHLAGAPMARDVDGGVLYQGLKD